LLEYLISAGGNVNVLDNDGDSPILFCEDQETFEFLLAHGANPEHRNFRGEGIFEKAVDDDNASLIEFFASKGYITGEQLTEAITRIENGGSGEGIELDMDELLAAAAAEGENMEEEDSQ
jgi:ankyrin repeat protein